MNDLLLGAELVAWVITAALVRCCFRGAGVEHDRIAQQRRLGDALYEIVVLRRHGEQRVERVQAFGRHHQVCV